jgi:hypothetical protein
MRRLSGGFTFPKSSAPALHDPAPKTVSPGGGALEWGMDTTAPMHPPNLSARNKKINNLTLSHPANSWKPSKINAIP